MAVATIVNFDQDTFATTPLWLQQTALAVIGLEVGLGFTASTVRQLARVFPLVLVAVVLMLGCCAAVGLALAHFSDVSALTGYLATTPGGFPVVLGVATASNTDATFVVSLQVLRVFIVLITAPLLARCLVSRARGTSS
jgi:uncharacterized protein